MPKMLAKNSHWVTRETGTLRVEWKLILITGWTVSTTCSDTGVYDKFVKSSAKYAVNGRYLYQHFATCDAGKVRYNKLQYTLGGPMSHGLVVRAVACEARGPGFDSSSDQMVFFSLGLRR